MRKEKWQPKPKLMPTPIRPKQKGKKTNGHERNDIGGRSQSFWFCKHGSSIKGPTLTREETRPVQWWLRVKVTLKIELK